MTDAPNYPGKGIGYHWQELMSPKFGTTMSLNLTIPRHLYVPRGTHNEERQHTPETEAHDQLLLVTDVSTFLRYNLGTIGIDMTGWSFQL